MMQNSGPWDTWLLVVENSWLFAQHGYSARCAPPFAYCPGVNNMGDKGVESCTARFQLPAEGAMECILDRRSSTCTFCSCTFPAQKSHLSPHGSAREARRDVV